MSRNMKSIFIASCKVFFSKPRKWLCKKRENLKPTDYKIMRKQIRLAALLVATGMVAASTQATTYPKGDLIVGFSSGTTNDFVYDLGAESSFTSGETWNLGSLTNEFTLSSVQWGVIGDNKNSGEGWTTTGGSTPNSYDDESFNLSAPIQAIYQFMPAAGAGNSEYIDPTSGASWNKETTGNASGSTSYALAYENPNMTGMGSDYFYYLTDGDVRGAGDTATLEGSFSLDGSGDLTFNPVPEPSTIGLITGAGLLMVTLRNKFRRK